MAVVKVNSNAPIDVALRRLKRNSEKEGIPTRLKETSAYEKPAKRRKRKNAARIKRIMKKKLKEKEMRERDRGLL